MAAFKGVNKTKADSPSGANIVDPGVLGGNVKVMVDNYVAVGTEVAGDTIAMGKALPKGARILEIILHTAASGTGVTLDVGDAESHARYLSIIDCSSAAIARLEAAELAGRHYEVDMTTASTPDNQILITVHAATTVLTAAAEIKLTIFYTHE